MSRPPSRLARDPPALLLLLPQKGRPEGRPQTEAATHTDALPLQQPSFLSWYWLKEELVVFSRTNGLLTSGSKPELNARIAAHLAGAAAPPRRTGQRPRPGAMPSIFTPETVIGPGWRCNPPLGAYLRQLCGPGFRFNAAVRHFIHTAVGKTLADAAVCYHTSRRPGEIARPIPRQLEYNQHFRNYFRANPEATRQQAIDAWWVRRGRPNPKIERDLAYATHPQVLVLSRCLLSIGASP